MAEIETILDASTGLERCGDLFRADPIGCNRVTTSLYPGRDIELLRVSDGGSTIGAAVTGPSGYTLTPLGDGCARLVAESLAVDRRLRIVGGPDDVAAIAGLWSERCDGAIDTGRLFRWYRLGEIHPRKPRGGSMRVAGRDRIDAAAHWLVAFGEEIGVSRTPENATRHAADAINEGRLVEWVVKGEVVSQLIVSPARLGVARINAVYTPPSLRKEGYSGTLAIAVAAQQIARQKVDEVVVEVPAADATPQPPRPHPARPTPTRPGRPQRPARPAPQPGQARPPAWPGATPEPARPDPKAGLTDFANRPGQLREPARRHSRTGQA